MARGRPRKTNVFGDVIPKKRRGRRGYGYRGDEAGEIVAILLVFLGVYLWWKFSGKVQTTTPGTSTGAAPWDSRTSWATARDITPGVVDPEDPRMFFPDVGDAVVRIEGGGIASISGGSPRLTIKGPWKSTEIILYTKGTFDWFAMHGGSDHHDESGTKEGTWGGYAMKIYQAKSDAGIQKEPIHGTFCRAVAKGSQGTSYTVRSNDWVGWRGIQKVEGNKVILEAYIDETASGAWKKLFTEEDTGNFPCGNDPFNKPQIQGGPIVWIRFNNSNIQVKDVTIKEIGTVGVGTTTTPTTTPTTTTTPAKTSLAIVNRFKNHPTITVGLMIAGIAIMVALTMAMILKKRRR